MTKKHTKKQHQRSDVSVLVLSLASVRLTLEQCINSKSKRCCSLDRFTATTAYRLRQWKRSLAITGDRLRVALFGGELSTVVQTNSKSRRSNTEMLVSPTLADSKRGDGAQKQFRLPAFAAEEISLLRDIVKYVYESRFDVVLLQEVQEEQTFVYLLQMFKEIKLRHAHYSRMDFRGSGSRAAVWCSSLCSYSDVHHTGLAVFSRWPLVSVTVQQFDPVLSTLQLSTFLPTMISNWFSRLAACGGTGAGVISEAYRLANGVQYVQLQVAMNGVQRATTVHLFNSDLLHRSFIKVDDGQKDELCPPPATDLEIWERNVLRFCQAYELAKMVDALVKTQQKQTDDIGDQATAKIGNSELVIIAGHMGRLQSDIFGIDCSVKPVVVSSAKKKNLEPPANTVHRLTVQDVLQTFIDGLQNAFERPEKVATAAVGGVALLNRSKSFRNGQLFHSLQSEQLFIKFLDSPPAYSKVEGSLKTKKAPSSKLPSKLPSSASNTSNSVHCRINFVQSKLRFESYANAVFKEAGDGTFHETMVTIESLRAVNIKLARGEAICIEPPGVQQQQQKLIASIAKGKEYGGGKTSSSSKKLSKKRTSPSVRNTMGQIEVKLVPPFSESSSKAKSTDQKLLVIEAFKSALERYQVHLRRALLFDCLPPYLCSLAVLSVAVLLKKLPMEACTVMAVAFLLILYFTFFRRLAAFRAKMSKIEWLLAQLNLERTHLQCRLVQKNFQPFESSIWEAYFREERSAVQMSSNIVDGSNGLDLKMMSNVDLDVMGSDSGINDSRILSHTSTATF